MTGSNPEVDLGDRADLVEALTALQIERAERERQITVLTKQLERFRREADQARTQAAFLKESMDRHLAQCTIDDGAVQRLVDELAVANARRKEQVAIIERRDQRILELRAKLYGSAEAPAADHRPSGKPRGILRRIKAIFSGHVTRSG